MSLCQNLAISICTILISSVVLAESTWQCQDPSSAPVPTRICIQIPENPNGEVLYYLHGKGGSPDDWVDPTYYPMQIQNYWQGHHMAAPIVIAIGMSPLSQFGVPNVWLLAEKNSHPASGLFEYFVDVMIPTVESQLPVRVTKRSVVGESMGGINTIQLAFKTRLFQKAASLCPVFNEVSPLSEMSVILSAAQKTVAWKYFADAKDPLHSPVVENALKTAHDLAGVFFDEAGWNSYDPFVLAKKTNPSERPLLYVTIGLHDEYASYESVEKWIHNLSELGIQPEWHPMWGGHCVMDIPSLAEFLQK